MARKKKKKPTVPAGEQLAGAVASDVEGDEGQETDEDVEESSGVGGEVDHVHADQDGAVHADPDGAVHADVATSDEE